jgi:orotate phosphoribosyltransferase
MDRYLAEAIIRLDVPQFGPSEKNKGDSPSCRFEPRHLLSSPDTLRYIGKHLADIVAKQCTGSTVVGMATSGIAWAALASNYSGVPMLYIRKAPEPGVSEKLLEGIAPESGDLILIDDLIFDGRSKIQAIESLREMGYRVSDVVVIIDRQLQRKKDGPPLSEAYDLRLHAMITMAEVVDYMQARDKITDAQLANLIDDYRMYERWDLPCFAATE